MNDYIESQDTFQYIFINKRKQVLYGDNIQKEGQFISWSKARVDFDKPQVKVDQCS